MPVTRSRTASLLAAAGAAFAVSAMIGAAPAVADDLVCSDSEVAVGGACVAVVSNTDAPPLDVTPLDSSPNDVAPPPLDEGAYVDSIISAPGYNAGTDDGGDHPGDGGGHGR
jgi:hypothetical protein